MKRVSKKMSVNSVRLVDDLLVRVSRATAVSCAVVHKEEELKQETRSTIAITSFIGMDDFAKKNFLNNSFSNSKSWINCDWKLFTDKCNEYWNTQDGISLKEGYAPFCKHLFVPVEYFHSCLIEKDIHDPMMEINDKTRSYLHSGYVRRRSTELPYLTRWFDRQQLLEDGVELPMATWFDIILYSQSQIIKEHCAMDKTTEFDFPHNWGIVSIKAQRSDHERPMEPITAMRNALPLEHGGSGTALSEEDYLKSVEFWDNHSPIQG